MLIRRLLDAVRSGEGLSLALAVQLPSDPNTLRDEWHNSVLSLSKLQDATGLMVWVNPAEFVRRLEQAAAVLGGDREVSPLEWSGFGNDPYGIEHVQMWTQWDWPESERSAAVDRFRRIMLDTSGDTRRRFFRDAEITTRISVSHMAGRTDVPDEIGVKVARILIGHEPPSIRDIVAAARRWRS